MCVDAPDPPQADPRMFEILNRQVELSGEALNFFRDAYRQAQERQRPLDEMNLRLGENLLEDAATNRERSREAYDFYKQYGRPVQQQFLEESRTIDSESNIANARGRAIADVAQAAGNAREANARSERRFQSIVNPARMASINAELAAQEMAAAGGAATNAEQGQRDRGVAMRSAASNLAAGFPAQSMAFGNQATGQGQAAFGNQVTANNANNSTAALMQSGYGTAGNFLNAAQSGYGSIYGNQVNMWGQQANMAQQDAAGFGQLLGLGGAMLFASSEDTKENKETIDARRVLKALRETPVEAWNYKGESPMTRRIGPMAEDMNAKFGNAVAPRGKAIDVGSALGTHHAAIQALADEIDELRGRNQGKGYSTGGKVTGPGTGTSDDIPARLSHGEYIVPASVVRAKGTEFFDKLLERHSTAGTPVHLRKKALEH